MRKNGVILDFNDNCVVINGTRWPATKVERKGNDPRLRRYRAVDKKKKLE